MIGFFVCVFNPADAQKLTDSGGQIASYDGNNNVWIFYNDEKFAAFINQIEHLFTDVLTLSEGAI